MTKTERNRLEADRVLGVWLTRLRLTDWEIVIRWDLLPGQKSDGTGEVDTDLEAEIRVHDYHEQASIRLCATWEKWDATALNRTLVHELLHVYEKETQRPAEQTQNTMGKKEHEIFWGWYVAGRERWVEKMARVLVELAGLA